ncbi:MAG: DUF6538 domain-containing protein [Cyanobacteria bacterium P01_B01_bin.77]
MTFRNPSYITKTKHGVYYFQVRIPKYFADRVGLKNPLIRKSLRTKNRKLALSHASRIWSRLYLIVYVGEFVSGKKTGKEQLAELLDQEDVLADYAEHSRTIKIALRVTDEYGDIPDWDADGREIFFDSLSHEEREALEYVAREAIDLSEYRDVAKPAVQNIDPNFNPKTAYLKSELLSVLKENFHADKMREKPNTAKSTVKERLNRLTMFIDIVGDKQSKNLCHADIDRYKELIPDLPKNRNKSKDTKDLTIEEMCKLELAFERYLAPKTIKDYTQTIRSYLNWCVEREFMVDNIALPIKTFYGDAESNPYLPFDETQLKRLLHSKEYLEGVHKKPSHYWLPLIGLFSGVT